MSIKNQQNQKTCPIKESTGNIIWIEKDCVSYRCECGECLVVYLYEHHFENSICPKCGKEYFLVQTNTVYEVANI